MFKYLLLFITTIPYTQFRPPYNISTTAVYLSKTTDQSGTNHYCAANQGTQAYTCTFGASQVLTILTPGMTVIFVPDVSSGTNPTLVIDSVGAPVSIYQKDGVTAATLTKGEPYLLFYDGTIWRILA